ncbi:MAG: beta-propeller domain-containing protein [Thermoplasmatota archaeon]
MRAWIVLLFLPLAGCLGGGPASVSPFFFDAITRGDPTPVAQDRCIDLLDVLNERADLEARVRLDQSLQGSYHRHFFFDDMEVMAVAESAGDGAPSAASGALARDADVTGTNNQEAGADEADLMKTDGEWTYVLQQGQLIILHSETVGNLTEVSRTSVGSFWGGQLLLAPRGAGAADDRLVIITQGEGPKTEERRSADIAASSYYAPSMTRIAVYSLADRASPSILDEVWVEGSHVSSRLIDGHAYVVAHEWERNLGLIDYVNPWPIMEARSMEWEDWERMPESQRRALMEQEALDAVEHNRAILANLTLQDHMPRIYTQAGSSLVAEPITEAACQRFLTTPDDTGRSVSSILAMDVDGLDHQVTQIISGHPIVYGAPGSIVLASSAQNDWWYWAQPQLTEATNLHWFDLDGLDVDHRASGRVDGIVQDQFGIDVHQDQLRVATTTGQWGRWWVEDPDPMMNHLVVLRSFGKALIETGRVGDIAPEERLWSARFTDDRAYLITFEQIDPLWIIDLEDPTDPKILGELEIPGVSTYIHPLSDELLLTIGIGPGKDDIGLDWSRLQVSLFDISDESRPVRADVMDLSAGGDGWSYSVALHEHKAFTYWDRLDMLAVPLSSHNYGEVWNAEAQEWEYRESHHIGLQLIEVDQARKELRLYGEVDQNHLLEDGQSRPCGSMEIERSYFLGFPDRWPMLPVSVYSISGLGVSAHDLDTLEAQDHVAFGLEGCNFGYYEDIAF